MHSTIIIGCGRIAGGRGVNGHFREDSHLDAIKANNSINLVGCVDIDIDRAKLFTLQSNCAAFSNIDEAIETLHPHLVIICTPDKSHFSVALRVLSSLHTPKLIFIEKPVCLKLSEYEELLMLARSKGVIIIVNHTRRFNNAMIGLKKKISAGFFGSLDRVNATYYGGWFHNGVHLVDILSFLISDEIEVSEVTKCLNSSNIADPTIECEAFFKNGGARIRINGILEESLYQLFEFDFWFQKGRLRIEDFGSRIIFERKIQNEIGENVLIGVEFDSQQDHTSALFNAYKLIADSLASNDYSQLNDVRLDNIFPTMKALWHGKHLLRNLP